jgi:agmatinase
MVKFAWADEKKQSNANVVIFGVADESGSHAMRKGTSRGPDKIRKISTERAIFTRKGIKSITLPHFCSTNIRLFDAGNIPKKKVTGFVANCMEKSQIPIGLGGDHSITFEILKGLKKHKKVSVVYFDAHPDFVCSSRNYYGSVVCDVLDLKHIDLKASLEIGNRAIEKEEMINLKKQKIMSIEPEEIVEKGAAKVFEIIKRRVRKGKIYLSIDMDAVDPAFAPGVDTPVPGGLNSAEILYFVHNISSLGLLGMDVMETSPPYDYQNFTSQLAGRLVMEAISTLPNCT